MAKVRVYELARELGVESKELIHQLADMGEFVKSASSTIEAPVVRRLRDSVKAAPPKEKEQPAAKPAAPTPATAKKPAPSC